MRNVPITTAFTIPCSKCGGQIIAYEDIDDEWGYRYLAYWRCEKCGRKIKGYTHYEREDKWIWEYEEDK